MRGIAVEEVLVVLIAFANLYSLLHFGFYLVGANFYDILSFRKSAKKRVVHAAQPGQPQKHPLVSVVIPAYNEEVNIRLTLDSIYDNTYPNIEAIIVNDGSTDDTPQIVRRYIQKTPGQHVGPYEVETLQYQDELDTGGRMRRYRRIILVNQDNVGKAEAMNNGICSYARGEFVMCLDGDAQLHALAIERALGYFDDSSVVGVAANVRIKHDMSWLGLLQQFEHIIGYRSKKFYSMTASEFIIGGVASTYRMSTLEKVNFYDTDTVTEDIALSLKVTAHEGNRQRHIVYASDVIAYTEGVHSYAQLLKQRYRWKMGMLQSLYKYRRLLFNRDNQKYSRFLTLYRLPMALLSELLLLLIPVMFGYIIYASIAYHRFDMLLGAYATITLYTLCNVWPDEYLSRKEKFYMTLQGFFMYVAFYTMDVVQLIAAYRCVKNFKQIQHGAQGHATWIPPTRKKRKLVT